MDGGSDHLKVKETVAALQRLGEEDLRTVVLEQLQENHHLRARLTREEAAHGKLREQSRQREAEAETLSRRFGELFEEERLRSELPAEEYERLVRYRRSSTVGRPRRPASSLHRQPPPPILSSRRPMTAPAVTAGGSGGGGAVRSAIGARLHVTLRIVPGAIRGTGQWVETLALSFPMGASADDVERALAEEGLRWEPPRPCDRTSPPQQGDGRVDAGSSRLLFKGCPLRRNGSSLASQGVRDGSEFRLLRAKALPDELRCRSGHEPGAQRGLLMAPGAPAWTAPGARLLPEEFFGGMGAQHRPCVEHIVALANAKVGRVKGRVNNVYLDA